MDLKIVNLEVLYETTLPIDKNNFKERIFDWLLDYFKIRRYIELAKENDSHYTISEFDPEKLGSEIKCINLYFDPELPDFFDQDSYDITKVNKEEFILGKIQFVFHFYMLYDDVYQNDLDDSESPCSYHVVLPSKSLVRAWENLYFDTDLKRMLLNYIRTSIMFAKNKVHHSVVNWNKVILLHGPPGTGKTTLCKALCQKASIVLNDQFKSFQLIEINAHSLFSKWFSESGKLVLKLFQNITEFAKDSYSLIFILIDEVESLAYNRQKCNTSDPSDAIRVVNALLTEIDKIKKFSNVIILSTSNITDAMDNAFIDRVDLKQFLGNPSKPTIYSIYRSCIQELIATRLVDGGDAGNSPPFMPWSKIKRIDEKENQHQQANTYRLSVLADLSENFNGRTLRKIPFLAFAWFYNESSYPVSLDRYLDLLKKAIIKQMEDNKHF